MSLTPQNLKTYLNAILSPPPNRRPWHGGAEFYTPTQALPLKVQVSLAQPEEQKAKQPDDRQEQKLEAVEVLEGLGKYALEEMGHVLLIGKPGSGKSTALQQLLRKTARDALDGLQRAGTPSIPVLIELRGVPPQLDVWLWIQATFEAKGVTVEVEALKSQKLLLLFDGLNEAGWEVLKALGQFLDYYDVAKMPVVCTTRQLAAGADLGIQKRLELLPLSDGQMRQFVAQRFRDEPGKAEVLLRQLQDRLRELAETPLLLQMLCDVCANRGEIPANRGELFRQEFSDRYARFKKASTLPNQELLPDLLMHLASTMMQGEADQPTAFVLQLSRTEAQHLIADFLQAKGETSCWSAAKDYLHDLLSNHLLQENPGDPNYIKFHHQLFQEYYAAEWLLQQWPTLDNLQRKCHYLNYLKWTESIALMAGLLDNKGQSEKLIELSLEVDSILGARLVGKVKESFQEKATELIHKTELSDWLYIKLLEEAGTNLAINGLLEFTKSQNEVISFHAVRALSIVGNEGNISNALIDIASNQNLNEHLRNAAIEALGCIKSKVAVPICIDFLNDERFVYEACEALGNIGCKTAVPSLLRLLENSDNSWNLNYVGKRVAEALGKIGDADSISFLIKLICNQNTEISSLAWQALIKIGSEDVSSELVKVLRKSNDLDLCFDIAHLLTILGHSLAIPALINFLFFDYRQLGQEDNCRRWILAVRRLKVFDTSVTSELIDIVTNSDDAIAQIRSARALGELKYSEAVSTLCMVLSKQENSYPLNPRIFDFDFLAQVINSLNKLGLPTRAIPLLENLLDYEPSWEEDMWGEWNRVEMEIVSALAEIGNKKILPFLLKYLDHSDLDKRFLAISALGKLKEQSTVPVLIKLLENYSHCILNDDDDYYFEFTSVLEALRYFRDSDEKISTTLSSFARHENPQVRSEVVKALGFHKSKRAVLCIIEALWDEDKLVKNESFSSLKKIGWREVANIAYADRAFSTLFDLLLSEIDSRDRYDTLLHWWIIDTLTEIGDRDSIPRLVEMTNHASPKIRQESLQLLGSIASSFPEVHNEIIKILLEAKADQDLAVKFEAIKQLWLIGDQSTAGSIVLENLKETEIKFGGDNSVYWLDRIEKYSLLKEIPNRKDDLAIEAMKNAMASSINEIRIYAMRVLSRALRNNRISTESAVPCLVKGITDREKKVNYEALKILQEVKNPVFAQIMPELLLVLACSSNSEIGNWPSANVNKKVKLSLETIQKTCQFYNYEIYQQALSVRLLKRNQPMSDKSNSFDGAVFKGPVNFGTVRGDQIGTQNNCNTEQNFEIVLADLKSFIDEVQQRHPNVTTEETAIQVIDAEFRELQTTQPTRWKNFLSLKRLWNGGKKGAFKVAEHFSENNGWAKGLVAAIEDILEDPK